MGWPQYAVLAMMFLSLGISMARHGEPKRGKESLWFSLISNAITFALLYLGGFFKQ